MELLCVFAVLITTIIKNLKTSSYQELYDYTSIIYLVLNIIYEENTSKIIYNRVYKIAYNLINAKKNNLDELEIKYKLELEKMIIILKLIKII